jgi:hypothetical protein
MTPLIQKAVALFPEEAADYQWFDMSAAYKPEVTLDADIMDCPIPFPMTAMVCTQDDGLNVLMLMKRFEDYTAVIPMAGVNRLQTMLPFMYKVEDGQVLVGHPDGTKFDFKFSPTTGHVAFVAAFLKLLRAAPMTGYTAFRRANHSKKIRQGKIPQYDWKTILVEAPKQKGDDQGGTHASPRWHERRGHWRKVNSGKIVWVKNCEVGDKKLGAVFHDYQITNQTQGQ